MCVCVGGVFLPHHVHFEKIILVQKVLQTHPFQLSYRGMSLGMSVSVLDIVSWVDAKSYL